MPEHESNSTRLIRFRFTQKACRYLPPIISQQVRRWLYKYDWAQEDDRRLIARAQTGSRLEGTTKEYHFFPFSIHGYYEWRNVTIALVLASKGDTIIEIGANIGTETISFADIVGARGVVHAFEPLPPNAESLRNACELSQYKNIVVHQCALSDKHGHVEFTIPPNHTSGIGHLVQNGERCPQTLHVDCRTLDSLAGQVGSARLIFIDTEGEEVRVLRGAGKYIEMHKPTLVLEASPALLRRSGFSLSVLYEMLRDAGYCIYKITRFGLRTVQPKKETKACNWLCMRHEQKDRAKDIQRCIRRVAFMPCMPGLSPLAQRSIM